jgi:hypothetical protein
MSVGQGVGAPAVVPSFRSVVLGPSCLGLLHLSLRKLTRYFIHLRMGAGAATELEPKAVDWMNAEDLPPPPTPPRPAPPKEEGVAGYGPWSVMHSPSLGAGSLAEPEREVRAALIQ